MDAYLELKRLWGGEEPGPHVVYGDVLVPFIRATLAPSAPDSQLAVVMEFLEELSAIADADILDVIVTSVLEPLLDEEDRSLLEDSMGPRTRTLWMQLIADME